MRISKDHTFPFRLDHYRPDQFGDPKGKKALVLVHGFSAKVHPMQWLMHVLADQLSDHAIYQYGFETYEGLIPNSISLEEASRVLGHELLRVKREHLLGDGVAFVGHSTGGVIARRCFIDYQAQLGRGAFVFLGTPHYGAEIASIKNKISLAFSEKQTRELISGSDFIWRLNRDWMRLPEGAIEKVLCVVGAESDRSCLGLLPKGSWVQSDGVVRSTSASLTPRGDEPCLLLHVPLVHTLLKDIAPEWRKLSALSKDLFEHPPVPSRDLPFMAAVGLLRTPQDVPNLADAVWTFCLNYFQEFEKEWRETEWLKTCFEKDADGNWSPRTEKEIRGEREMIKFGLEPPKGFYALPREPSFLEDLNDFQKKALSFWSKDRPGSALVRLDFLEVPPQPQLLDIIDSNDASVLRNAMNHRAAAVRLGPRWLTVYVPELPQNEYRFLFSHADRKYQATVKIRKHLTTLVEVNGYNGRQTELTKGCDLGLQAATKFYAGIQELSTNKKWDLELEKPWIDVRE